MKTIIFTSLIIILSGCTSDLKVNEDTITYSDLVKGKKYHGKIHIDEFDWIRDKNYPTVSDPKILKFIGDENKVTNSYFQKNKKLVNTVLDEIIGRKPVQKNISFEDENYIYTSKYIEKAQYLTHYIRNKKTDKIEILLDERSRAANNKYYQLMFYKVSPDGRFLVWIEDDTGHEDGTIYIKDLKNNKILTNQIKNVSEKVVWDGDSKSFYYIKKDSKGRDYQIESLSIETPYTSNILYTESDESFHVWLKPSISNDKIFIYSYNWINRETHLITKNSEGDISTELLISRELYSIHDIDYINGDYYLYTNYFNENFDLVKMNNNFKTPEKWKRIVNKDSETFFKEILFFDDFFAIPERKNGIDKLRIVERKTGSEHYINFDEKIVGITFHDIKQQANSNILRVRVESNLTPRTIYDYNTQTKKLDIVSQVIVDGYNKSNYVQERLLVPSNDGTKIPVTLIYSKKFGANIDNPLYMYVYGSYGEGIPPEFPSFAMSAIDRGFTYAIAHVRGGDELGKKWHDEGKLLKRKNTFNDFLSISQYLIDEGYVAKGNISASGESAAGTTIGVAINEKPELYKSVTVLVPFVDVLNSLMDTSLEYTMTDWSEYGNPVASKEVFDYIKSYSPYDNIKKQKYPNIYVTGGIDDPAVGYWESAKWVSKIRANQTNQSLTLLSFRDGGHIDSGTNSVNLDFAKQISFLLLTQNIKTNSSSK